MTAAKKILVAAINARFSHASLGTRYLLANLGDLRECAAVAEFTLQQSATDIAAAIAARRPRILGLGVYIWNRTRVAELLPRLRQLLPELVLVIGGPELTAGAQQDPAWATADYMITGEGEVAFANLCRAILDEQPPPPLTAKPPDLSAVQLPYDEYSDDDLAHRLLYVEASRGCAMNCDYCVSANDHAVRFFPLPPLFAAFEKLLARGARLFKFCDRSFNHDPARAAEILDFFQCHRARYPDIFLHLEMFPDRFPKALRTRLASFPPRSLQLEIGVQSFNPTVLKTIRRPQNLTQVADHIRFLRAHTEAWLHVDLIAGLPGETPASFAAGFDQLAALEPHEIQLGILKKLPGAPIARHDETFDMRYRDQPPYEVWATRDWPADHLVRTARFAHYWDAIVNSQRFIAAVPLLWQGAPSVFAAFMELADWLGPRFAREHGVPLSVLMGAVFEFLTTVRGLAPPSVAAALIRSYRHIGARDIPPALAPHLLEPPPPPGQPVPRGLRRQFLRWTWPAIDQPK